jgi:hypothetical protein
MILPRLKTREELFSGYILQRNESDKFGMMIWTGIRIREIFLSE